MLRSEYASPATHSALTKVSRFAYFGTLESEEFGLSGQVRLTLTIRLPAGIYLANAVGDPQHIAPGSVRSGVCSEAIAMRDYSVIIVGFGILLLPCMHYVRRSLALWLGDSIGLFRYYSSVPFPVMQNLLACWSLTDTSVIRVRIILKKFRAGNIRRAF